MRAIGVIGAAAVAATVLSLLVGAGVGKTATSGFRWRLVTSALSSPVHVTAPKSEPTKLYVVEQEGRIVVLVRGKLRRRPFLDIRSLVRSGGEQGLLSVAFHPRYRKNRRLYVDYTDVRGDTRVVEYRANRARTRVLPRTRRQLFTVDQPYENHNGGQLAFGPDGYLYIGMGDGGSGGDPGNRAQNLRSRLGKLLKINARRRGAKPRIVAYGLRNPWRFSFDRKTGNLVLADVGQDSWEEIDYLPRRQRGLVNFGWRVYEGRSRYTSERPNPAGRLVFPIHVYSHSLGCSVTGGFVYRGPAAPSAHGLYFFGDYCSGRVWTMRIRNGRATRVRLRSQRIGQLSSFGESTRGDLYAVALSGRLYKLVRS